MRTPGVRTVRGNMCAQGMFIRDSQGLALALKATGWCSNSEHILRELNKQCSNNSKPEHQHHRHACLQNGKAKHAAIYPEQLCFSILRGLRNEMESMGLSLVGKLVQFVKIMMSICSSKKSNNMIVSFMMI